MRDKDARANNGGRTCNKEGNQRNSESDEESGNQGDPLISGSGAREKRHGLSRLPRWRRPGLKYSHPQPALLATGTTKGDWSGRPAAGEKDGHIKLSLGSLEMKSGGELQRAESGTPAEALRRDRLSSMALKLSLPVSGPLRAGADCPEVNTARSIMKAGCAEGARMRRNCD